MDKIANIHKVGSRKGDKDSHNTHSHTHKQAYGWGDLPSSEQADKTPGLTEDVGSTDSVGIGSRMVGARESSPLVVRLPQPFHYSPSFCGFDWCFLGVEKSYQG